MKEVTRIHLAKIPYNIELAAKRRLEKYLNDLEAYAGDDEILPDVELRMTELLDERHVRPDGTIVMADIEALEHQLGEPAAFSDDSAGTKAGRAPAGAIPHRLYRDRSQSLLGGVASGLARYFGVNVWWVRLVFVVLAFASFGAALVVYIVLWIVIPPVKSPSDWLQLEGRPVTLAALREFGSTAFDMYKVREQRIIRAVTIVLGLGFVLATLIALAITGWGAYEVFMNHRFVAPTLSEYADVTMAYISVGLLLGSGLLLATLMALGAYASFARKRSRALLMSAGVIMVLGLASFGVGGGGMFASQRSFQAAINTYTKQETLALPAGFENIQELTTATEGARVTYTVTNDQPKITLLHTLRSKEMVKPAVTVTGTTARITIGEIPNEAYCDGFCAGPEIHIYGPALTSITAEGGQLAYATKQQSALNLTAKDAANIEIIQGEIDTLSATIGENAGLTAHGASIKEVNAKTALFARLKLATVQALRLDTPVVCPSGRQASIELVALASGNMTLNGQVTTADSQETPCANISFSPESNHPQPAPLPMHQ